MSVFIPFLSVCILISFIGFLALFILVYFWGNLLFFSLFRLSRGDQFTDSIRCFWILYFFENDWLNGLLDSVSRFMSNMFVNLTGHVNLENYLLQRRFILLM